MNSWYVVYKHRYKVKYSEPFENESEIWEWIESLENEVGGYADAIIENDLVRYRREIIDTNAYWRDLVSGEYFDGYRR